MDSIELKSTAMGREMVAISLHGRSKLSGLLSFMLSFYGQQPTTGEREMGTGPAIPGLAAYLAAAM
jgi:hypothetical protein